ncbi:guanine nucleotide binding protein, alpha subunit [Schizophyllum amplum]|uniref:Guanine nucleotide binding protein, alpha subunit n=1 Tax=Schizophyllum amplum TaxID=97359 RepID=A0A550C6E0_9AGAR|nr:guanine nucleotide binding protein, alpha subunit [Auriculariopsis ampla]
MPARPRASTSGGVDAFDAALRPPPNETPEEREARLAREEEARRVSAEIDAEIKAERQAKKKKRIVRLLLLGQSESGKSTTLRQFQRLYTPTAFREERILWRAVIQLNVVRSMRTILDAVHHELATAVFVPAHKSRSMPSRPRHGPAQSNDFGIRHPSIPGHRKRTSVPALDAAAAAFTTPGAGPSHVANYSNVAGPSNASFPNDYEFLGAPPTYDRAPRPHHGMESGPESDFELSEPEAEETLYSFNSSLTLTAAPLETLRARLEPLRHVERMLVAKLVPPNEDEATRLCGPNRAGQEIVVRPGQEVFVRPGMGWRGALAKARVLYPSGRSASGTSSGGSAGSGGSSSYSGDRTNGGRRTSTSGSGGIAASISGFVHHTRSISGHPRSHADASHTQHTSSPHNGTPSRHPSQHQSQGSPHRVGPSASKSGRQRSRPSSVGNIGLESPDEAQEVLHSCRRDMITLWLDPDVRTILRKRKIRLEDSPGFFLNDLERVTSLRYMPTDEDVLKARLKTVGVSEYKFEMEVSAKDTPSEWRIVDVGGSRTTWAPFFDDVEAIIFLAPISAFDQVLVEDKTVNRLEDSVLLWKAVCSNKLLANVDVVLFLNKCDILEAKLNSGIRFSKYVRSYSDRENTLEDVSKYLRSKFSAIHREYSPSPRKFYAFCTSVTDTQTTSGIIASVRDMVIRQHLKQSKLM